jgi:hypothetical protein
MRPIRSLVVGAIAIWLASCAASTPSIQASTADPHRYTELVPGTSTRDDAVAKLGPPNAISNVGNGNVLLQWFDYNSPRPIHLGISFGPDGRMVRVESVILP